MNESTIHVSYIFGNKQNLSLEKTELKTEELGSKRGQQKALTDQRGKTNAW